MFEITYPWMLVLLPLPLLVYKFAPEYKESRDSVRSSMFDSLVKMTGQTPSKGAVVMERIWFQKLWVPIAWVLLVCAMCKPMYIGEPIEQTKSARDLMIAVDLSGSMETQDFTTSDGNRINRLQAVKQVLKDFVAEREHDRLGLIVFGSSPYLQSPFTEDHETWITLLNESEIAMAGQSTKFGDAIGLAIKIFEGSETDNRVLIVLTDGNDTDSKVPPVEAAKVAASKQIKIYPIAIGDPETTGEEALDLDVMEAIAEETGGGYYQALDREQLEQAYLDITRLEPEEFETLSYRPKYSLHHYFVLVMLAGYVLFLSLMTLTAWMRDRRANHA